MRKTGDADLHTSDSSGHRREIRYP